MPTRKKKKQARPRADIAAAVRRVQREVLVPVADLRDAAGGATTQAVVRWIILGKGGVYMDGVHDPRRGWLSSAAAVARFLAALAGRAAG